jgi:hypothetical protein
LVYDEPLSNQKIIALLLIPVSMSLLWVDKRQSERRRAALEHMPEPIAQRKEAK